MYSGVGWIREEISYESPLLTLISGIDFIIDRSLRCTPKIYRSLAPRYYRFRASNDIYEYDHPPDPFKIEWVDPSEITRFTQRDHPAWKNRRLLFGAVKDGNWDRPGNSSKRYDDITRSSNYRILEQRFVEGLDWHETDKYKRCIKKIERGESTWKGATSKEELDQVCAHMDTLYNSIKSEGYRSVKDRLDNTDAIYPRGTFLDILNEVTVDIARDGELLLVDGKHRLTISKILNVDSIPIVFLVRHKRWMEHRDDACKQGFDTDHPDLRQLS